MRRYPLSEVTLVPSFLNGVDKAGSWGNFLGSGFLVQARELVVFLFVLAILCVS